jgi:hypothetical protein
MRFFLLTRLNEKTGYFEQTYVVKKQTSITAHLTNIKNSGSKVKLLDYDGHETPFMKPWVNSDSYKEFVVTWEGQETVTATAVRTYRFVEVVCD